MMRTFSIPCSKRFRLLVINTFLVLSFTTALAGSPPKPPQDLLFGARQDAAPLSYRDGDDWKGYTIDLCKLILDRYIQVYKASSHFVSNGSTASKAENIDFRPILAGERMAKLVSGDIDVMCGATTVTVNRMERVDFTLLTFVSGTGIMKKRSTNSSILANPGKRSGNNPTISFVGCSKEMNYPDCTTTHDWITRRFGSAITRLPKETHNQAFEALAEDEADFYVGDRVILANTLKSLDNETSYQLAPGFLTFEPYAIAIRKGNDLLLYAANAALAELYRESAKINKLYHNYFDTEQSDMLKAMYRLQAIPK